MTIIERGVKPWALIGRESTPTPVAAIFASNTVLVTRTPRDVRIWRLDSPKRTQLTPYARWTQWRKQLGLFDSPAGFRWDAGARDVRRY